MSAPQRCWHGAFCILGAYTPLSRCNTLDFVPKSCAKGATSRLSARSSASKCKHFEVATGDPHPLGIPAHTACGRCGFAAQKTLTKAYLIVCGEEKALLRKCNNPLCHFQPYGLQSVVGSPRGNGYIGSVSGKSLRTCVREVGTHVRSKTAKFLYNGMFFR